MRKLRRLRFQSRADLVADCVGRLPRITPTVLGRTPSGSENPLPRSSPFDFAQGKLTKRTKTITTELNLVGTGLRARETSLAHALCA